MKFRSLCGNGHTPDVNSLRHCLNAAVKRLSACCGSENAPIGAAKPEFFYLGFQTGHWAKLISRLDSAAEPVIGPARGRTRWRRPGMTPKGCAHHVSSIRG